MLGHLTRDSPKLWLSHKLNRAQIGGVLLLPLSAIGVSRVMKLNDLSVLVVDDDPNAIRIMKMVLSDLRISQISTAKDGIHALEIVAQDETVVHLIICAGFRSDSDMLQLLKEVRNSHPKILFMVVTENVDAESVLAMKEAGVEAIIAKPITVNQFEEKLLILARRL